MPDRISGSADVCGIFWSHLIGCLTRVVAMLSASYSCLIYFIQGSSEAGIMKNQRPSQSNHILPVIAEISGDTSLETAATSAISTMECHINLGFEST